MSQRFEQFGKYLLLEKLATGGMAEVFLARAQAAGGITKFAAIKRILPQFAESQEFVDMFKAEAKIAVNLSHSNIVSIYDFGVQAGQFYLVMDYVEGRNLRQILNKMKKANQRLSVDQIVYIIKEVSGGLDHAHRCLDGSTGKPLNITHRDMSPQNVMVSFEGEVKIVDFGIAKAESQIETTRAGTLKGKFGYMSPEQAEGQTVDLRTDIFSLGIVLWELLTNDRLFVANNEMNTLRKIRDCQVPSLRKVNPNIPAELERITMKALARDRNLRYQTAAAMHRDLNRFLNRHYPEFSPQDFAGIIKTLFSEEIFTSRQRLVEYAKIPVTDLASTPEPGMGPMGGMGAGQPTPSQINFGANTDSFVPRSGSASNSGSQAEDPDGSSISSRSANSNPALPSSTFSKSDFRPALDGSKPDLPAPSGPPREPTRVGIALPKATSEEATRLSPSAQAKSISEIPKQAMDRASAEAQARNRALFGAPGTESIEEISQPSISRRTKSTNSIHIPTPSSGVPAGRVLTIGFMILVATMTYVYAAKMFPNLMTPVVSSLDPLLRPLHVISGLDRLILERGHSEPGQKDNASVPDVPPLPTPTPAPRPDPTPESLIPETTSPDPTRTAAIPPPPEDKGLDAIVDEEMDPEPLRADEPRESFYVTSSPSGAEIYVNGQATGFFTPRKIEVPASRPFNLMLRRAGYIDYRKPGLSVDITRRLAADMQRALVGFLDIDVLPPQNARVYVNGQLLKGEQLPIKRYAVPAETTVVIRAENPLNQTYVEQNVRVVKDKRHQVNLDMRRAKPKKPNRLPSRSR